MRLPAAPRALREREFRLLFAGQTVSLVGEGMVGVALAFAVLDLTGSVTDLGLVLAAFTLPLVAFLLVGGVLADRFQPRRVMLGSDLARFLSQGSSPSCSSPARRGSGSSSCSRRSAAWRSRSSSRPRRR